MKLARSRLASLLAGALALGGISTAVAAHATRAPVVITLVPVYDGSNASRTPFPAQRPRPDIRRPDGQAIAPDMAPNTPSTSLPMPPLPVVAIMQRPGQDRTQPELTPTGPETLTIAATVDAPRVAPGLDVLAFSARESALADLTNRREAANKTANSYRDTLRDMAAADRDRFKEAAAELTERDNALNQSLKLASEADVTGWDAARAQLATDFDGFAAAAAKLDAIAASLHPSI